MPAAESLQTLDEAVPREVILFEQPPKSHLTGMMKKD
jgi:hypothetical protein